MRECYPLLSWEQLGDAFQSVLAQHRDENTALFHLVYSTIDLCGIRQAGDTTCIKTRFHNGPHRDGYGLLAWCDSLVDSSDVSGQDDLQCKLAGFSLNANASVDQIEAHCTDLLSIWQRIHGNSIQQPASFNWRLLSSMPTGMGQIGALRSWLASKISDRAPILDDPFELIDALLRHAKTLGITGGESDRQRGVYAVGRDGRPQTVFGVPRP